MLSLLHISHFAPPMEHGAGWQWFGRREHGASAMRNLGTHSLHLLTWLLGPVESVAAHETTGQPQWSFPNGESMRPDVADTAQLLLRFASGTIGTLALGWASPALTGWYLQVTGERATLTTDDPSGLACGPRVTLRRGAGNDPMTPVDVPPELISPAGIHFAAPPAKPQTYDIANAVQGMIRVIREGGTTVPSFEDAFHVEAVLDAARRAIASRAWVDVEDD